MARFFVLCLLWLHPICAENFILFLVEAPHFDYSSPRKFLQTFAKHPSNWSKRRTVGHAWIYIEGEGKTICLEGGHSGELGIYQPTYAQGICHNVHLGSKNPVSYLFCAQEDGFFQKGNGGHKPTYAAKKSLTDEEFKKVLNFIQTYPYSEYSLTGRQCCSFIKELFAELGMQISITRTVSIPSSITIGKKKVILWEDNKYEYLTFDCPDLLEKQLKEGVKNKWFSDGLKLYKKL